MREPQIHEYLVGKKEDINMAFLGTMQQPAWKYLFDKQK